MKKPWIILLFILGLGSKNVIAQEKIKVVASASIFQDMAENLGGDLIDASSIVPIGGDPHVYEPTPSDAVLVASADLILVNGLTFEGWINELIENSGTKAKVVLITEGIDPIMSERYKGASDPHAWMDALYGKIYAQNISNALQEIDPDNKQAYESKLNAYLTKLQETHEYIISKIATIPENYRILITSHDAFAYYGKRYGIQLSAIMGISTDADVQTSDMVRVSKTIKESGVPAVFIESTINPKLLERIAADNNVSIGGELFSDSIGNEESGAHGYVEMLLHNTNVIAEALGQGKISSTKIDTDDRSSNTILYIMIGVVMVLAFSITLLILRKK